MRQILVRVANGGALLPQCADRVFLNEWIVGGNYQTVTYRLSDEQPIEWVPMMRREAVHQARFRLLDGEQLKSGSNPLRRQVSVWSVRKRQLS
jgi:hypothetical protein